MPAPSRCPNPACRNHRAPSRHWRRPYGSYPTAAHGQVRRVRCRSCGAESAAEPNNLVCTACGDWRTELVSGDEMLLAQVELAAPEPAAP